jgi:hypothetical protein
VSKGKLVVIALSAMRDLPPGPKRSVSAEPAASCSSLCHPALLGCLGSLQNPPLSGKVHLMVPPRPSQILDEGT